MGYYALIKEGAVDSVIVADADFVKVVPPKTLGVESFVDVSELEQRPSPGWAYDGKTFAAPPAPDPVKG